MLTLHTCSYIIICLELYGESGNLNPMDNARQRAAGRVHACRYCQAMRRESDSDGDGACVHRSVTNDHDAHNDQNPAMAITMRALMMMRRRRAWGGDVAIDDW